MSRKSTFFLFDEDLKKQLFSILRREGTTFTDWIHDSAQEYVKRHGAGNPVAPLDKWQHDPTYVVCPTILEADGHPWQNHAPKDLLRMEEILIKEKLRIHSVRKQMEMGWTVTKCLFCPVYSKFVDPKEQCPTCPKLDCQYHPKKGKEERKQ